MWLARRLQMKKSIHILNGLYVSLEAITAFDFADESQILIYTGDVLNPFIVVHDKSCQEGRSSGSFSYVKIQDLHRIKRELCKFFEIEAPKHES